MKFDVFLLTIPIIIKTMEQFCSKNITVVVMRPSFGQLVNIDTRAAIIPNIEIVLILLFIIVISITQPPYLIFLNTSFHCSYLITYVIFNISNILDSMAYNNVAIKIE